VAEVDRKTTYICGCPGYFHHAYDSQIGAKIDDCKHCERLKQQSKQTTDENQATLIP